MLRKKPVMIADEVELSAAEQHFMHQLEQVVSEDEQVADILKELGYGRIGRIKRYAGHGKGINRGNAPAHIQAQTVAAAVAKRNRRRLRNIGLEHAGR